MTHFKDLGLPAFLLDTLTQLDYQTPTPVQQQSIPILLSGENLLAQAQTGTGKTAAFALPAISSIDIKKKQPQVIVIAPTRELAIQVSDAFKTYAKQMKGVNVTPIYGGQSYRTQLQALKKGSHVIVGTPGRVMDHLRRKTLDPKLIKMVVLDEADEMLQMGFIDDVDWILDQIPNAHQTALFSATMPPKIKNLVKKYLGDAEKVHIKASNKNKAKIDQYFTKINNNQKLNLLARLLEVEQPTAAMIFARTKTQTEKLADALVGLGHNAAALNGDMNQGQREKVIGRLKQGSLDIVIATDVAARGIDVSRITHVFNYDIPHDTEAYTHRIGRTGRAGRSGKAFVFVTGQEIRRLKDLQRASENPITEITPPSNREIADIHTQQFTEKVIDAINHTDIHEHLDTVSLIAKQSGHSVKEIAAAMHHLLNTQSTVPFEEITYSNMKTSSDKRPPRNNKRKRSDSQKTRRRPERKERPKQRKRSKK